jgi:hypothetical protein
VTASRARQMGRSSDLLGWRGQLGGASPSVKIRSTRVPVHFCALVLLVAALVDAIFVVGRLPQRAHVQQVDEEVVRQNCGLDR